MIEQLRESFLDPIQQFSLSQLSPIRVLFSSDPQAACKEYKSASSEHTSVLGKYMAKRSIDSTSSSTRKLAIQVLAARKNLHKKTLEYCMLLNNLDHSRNHEFVQHIIALVYTRFSFYHQGFELIKDLLDPTVSDISNDITTVCQLP